MSLGGAVFLGVGAMVGAGIFALLGEAGALAGFGGLDLVPPRRHHRRAARLHDLEAQRPVPVQGRARVVPPSGASATRHLTGIASWLFYLAGIIVTAMVALSFGSYARSLFLPDDASAGWVKVFGVAHRRRDGARERRRCRSRRPGAVDHRRDPARRLRRVHRRHVDRGRSRICSPRRRTRRRSSIVAAVALTFFAYLGFAVIANTAESIPNPAATCRWRRTSALGDRRRVSTC